MTKIHKIEKIQTELVLKLKGLKYVQILKYRAASEIAKCNVFYIIIKILFNIFIEKIQKTMYYLIKIIFVSCKILQHHNTFSLMFYMLELGILDYQKSHTIYIYVDDTLFSLHLLQYNINQSYYSIIGMQIFTQKLIPR